MCCNHESVDLSLLKDVLDKYADVKGSLISILQKTQEIYGYIPMDAIYHISERTGLTPAELLSCHKIFSVPVTATTCACLTEQGQAMLGKYKATAVATPIASAKMGPPTTPITTCVKAGIVFRLFAVTVIRRHRIDLLSGAKDIIIDVGDITGVSYPINIIIEDLHGVHTVITSVLSVVLH